MKRSHRALVLMTLAFLCTHLIACSSESDSASPQVPTPALSTYIVSGSVSGLGAGKKLVIRNNGNHLTLAGNGDFTFSTKVADGASYAVSVLTQPEAQTCSVTNGSGTISGADVSNVAVSCSAATGSSYSVGGTVSGLAAGKSMVLRNNGADNLTVSANGSFAFSTALANGANYEVSVFTPPAGQTCSVTNGSGTVSSANVANAKVACDGISAAADKWQPGLYVKVEDWQLMSKTEMEDIYKELDTTPQLRGIKVILLWGQYENKNPSTGAITYDFSRIDAILARLAAISKKTRDNGTDPHGKHLILGFAWREFKKSDGAKNVLPSDLRSGSTWNGDAAWVHMRYDYLWAYKMEMQPGNYAYNLKLWDPTLLARIDDFLAALAARVDGHPNFNQIATTESATGSPIVAFAANEGEKQQYEGQLAIIRMMRKYFVNSLVIPDFNYSQEYVAQVSKILAKEGIGLGTSNINKRAGLNNPGPKLPGVLTYFPKLSGTVALAPEIQGDDYRGYGDKTPGRPPYDYLYQRARNDLKANYIVMQRNVPYWKGDGSTPSMLKFIQTYPAIINDTTGAGGLDSNKPAALYPSK